MHEFLGLYWRLYVTQYLMGFDFCESFDFRKTNSLYIRITIHTLYNWYCEKVALYYIYININSFLKSKIYIYIITSIYYIVQQNIKNRMYLFEICIIQERKIFDSIFHSSFFNFISKIYNAWLVLLFLLGSH